MHKVDFGKETCKRKLYRGWVMILHHYMEAGISFVRKVALSEKSRSSVEMTSQLSRAAISSTIV